VTAASTSGHWRERSRRPALIAYVAVLLIATLVPFDMDVGGAQVAERIARAFHPTLAGRDVVDGARNLVLFAGWGVVWSLTAAGGVRGIVLRATGTGAAISALVEILQLFSSNRTTSFLDLATNAAGAFAGAVGLIVLVALAGQRRGARSFVGIPTLLFAGTYGGALWFEAVIPLFRQQDLPIAYGGPLTRFAATLPAFRWSSIAETTISDLVIFLPAGAFAVATLIEHGEEYPEARKRVLAWGTGLSLLAELLHGFLGQPILAGAVLTHAIAVALGAWLAARYLPALTVTLRGQHRSRALTLLYAGVLAAWAWRPFLPEVTWTAIVAKITSRWYIPLAALGGRVDFFSVADVCAQFLLYLPLGGLLAVWPVRRQGLLAGPLPAVWLALILEAGQLGVWERTLDITIPLIQASGAIVGWAIIERAGFRVYGTTFPEARA
jgi:hypothetical protein